MVSAGRKGVNKNDVDYLGRIKAGGSVGTRVAKLETQVSTFEFRDNEGIPQYRTSEEGEWINFNSAGINLSFDDLLPATGWDGTNKAFEFANAELGTYLVVMTNTQSDVEAFDFEPFTGCEEISKSIIIGHPGARYYNTGRCMFINVTDTTFKLKMLVISAYLSDATTAIAFKLS